MSMDYRMRLELLNQKLVREGLTDAEKAEAALIHSMALLALREQNKELLEQLPHNIEEQKKLS